MKKILLTTLALIGLLSLFIVFNKKAEADEYTAYDLVEEYYNEGEYTKKSQIYLTSYTWEEFSDYFHVNATADRTTYYNGEYLLMGNLDGTFGPINSGYMSEDGKLYNFKYTGDKENPIKSKSKVANSTLDGYFVLLNDFLSSGGLLDQFTAESTTKFTFTIGENDYVEDAVNPTLHNFLWFACPGLDTSVFSDEDSRNYFSQYGMTLVIEEKTHEYYGEFLSIRIVLPEDESAKTTNPDCIFSEARVYKGNVAFDESDYLDFEYDITWKNEDGSLLSVDTVKWGVTPEFTGIIPSKADDDDYSYEFNGWDSEVVAAKENATYTAVFNKVPHPVPTFETKFVNHTEYFYRIGNANSVKLSSLFYTNDTVNSKAKINLTVEAYDGSSVVATYSEITDPTKWADTTIKFSGLGLAKITLNNFELIVMVVDGTNVTTASSATDKNVVLLNDAGFSSITISGGYALYGNGFKLTCASDSVALDFGYSFVTLNNGTLDNVQIICPNFDYAALYKSNLTSNSNRFETDAKGTKRYYNAKSGVMVSGDSQILNSYISGGRAAINVTGGNAVVENTRVVGGAVANILVGAANSLTLRDITLIQKATPSTYDSSKVLLGFSVLYLCDDDGNSTPTTLEGDFVQQAFVSNSDKKYVPSAGSSVVTNVLSKTEFVHQMKDADNVNRDYVNLGFAYMPGDSGNLSEPTSLTDNRSNKDTIPYAMVSISGAYVYTYKNTNGTDSTFLTETTYTPNSYNDLISVVYNDSKDGLSNSKSFGTDGWVYELNVDLDKATGYKIDFSKLSMVINGDVVNDYKVNGSAKPANVAVTAGGTTYTLTATIAGKTYTSYFKVTGTETTKESPSLVAENYEVGLCVASKKGGTWHGAAPALQGIQIKYWSVAEKQYKTINLAALTPQTKGKLNGTNTTWTYTPDNGDFTLTLTGGQVHSGNNVYAMPVVCDGKLYFLPSSSNGLVNSGNSARTIPVSYTFKDNNGGTVLSFSHTWSVSEDKSAPYNYSKFCDGELTTSFNSGSSDNCVTPDSLITLANGSQVKVSNLTGNEELLVWNLETGSFDKAPIMFVDSDPNALYEVVYLHFSDNTVVKVIAEHGFWDYDLNKYVYLDKNASDYIGHSFAKDNGNTLEKVQLVNVEIKEEYTSAWSPVTVGHLCYFVNGMLTMPGGVGGLFNIFEVNSETMMYDYEQLESDIETYGLFTYEEMNQIVPLSKEMFEAANGAYLKISIAKGNMTIEDLIYMIERYSMYI